MLSKKSCVLTALALLCLSCELFASAFISGAYYRLGDDDPGATAGTIGDNPTVDSFVSGLDLTRYGSPLYSSDVSPRAPVDSKLSMEFANLGLGGPATPAVYGRTKPLSMADQGYGLEMWVEPGPTNLLDPPSITSLLAYNGTPGSDGFGFFLDGGNFVARVGGFDRVLGPAPVGQWHHLAYVKTMNTVDYYYDGNLVLETGKDPLPTAATGGFWLGGLGDPSAGGSLGFNGWIDEVRYQSFNPMAAGAFDPTNFLIRPVPEPATTALMLGGLLFLAMAWRRTKKVFQLGR
jgi:hypothetical protein